MVMASLAWSLKAWSALWCRYRLEHRGGTQDGETKVVEDGVRDVLRSFHPDAVPDRAGWAPVDLPVARPGTLGKDVFLRLVERLHSCWLC